jgi:hypothetical protein
LLLNGRIGASYLVLAGRIAYFLLHGVNKTGDLVGQTSATYKLPVGLFVRVPNSQVTACRCGLEHRLQVYIVVVDRKFGELVPDVGVKVGRGFELSGHFGRDGLNNKWSMKTGQKGNQSRGESARGGEKGKDEEK